MVHKRSFSIFLLFLGLLFSSFSLGIAQQFPSKLFEMRFHLDETNSEEKFLEESIGVQNHALVQIYCFLFANSTNNITLLVEPAGEWNVSHIKVAKGQKINVTVTNGDVIPPFSDVPAELDLYILRESITDEVEGILVFLILDSGWHIAPWSLITGILAILLITIVRHRKVINQ